MSATLSSVFAEFSARLALIGPVVLAGGAVRDSLLGLTPKDYDVFVLGAADTDKTIFQAALADLPVVTVLDWHKSEPFLQGTFRFLGADVQVMASPFTTLESLVDSFDWNVSRFAFDGTTSHDYCPVSAIGEGQMLSLHKVTYPRSTLRRGFRFSERFKMRFSRADLDTLCRAVVADATPEQDEVQA